MSKIDDEALGKILFDSQSGSHKELSAEEVEEIKALRELDASLMQVFDAQAAVREPAADSIPEYLEARLQRELDALNAKKVVVKNSDSWWYRLIAPFRNHPLSAVGLAVVICLLVPVGLWIENRKNDEPWNVKTAPVLADFPAALLTPGDVTQFTKPVIIWFSSAATEASIEIMSLNSHSKRWKAERVPAEVRWNTFANGDELEPGGHYRLTLVADDKVLLIKDFSVASKVVTLPMISEDAVALTKQLIDKGQYNDALIVLATLDEFARRSDEVRSLRSKITTHLLSISDNSLKPIEQK